MITVNCIINSYEFCNLEETIEDILIFVSKCLKITPLCQHLFGLRHPATKLWPALYRKILDFDNGVLDFRMRFIPPVQHFHRLKHSGCRSLNFLFHQVKNDFLKGDISKLIEQSQDGLGLTVMDILCHLKQNPDISVEDVKIKEFMPPALRSLPHSFNVKKNVKKLEKSACDYQYIQELYIKQGIQSSDYGREELAAEIDTHKNVKLIIDLNSDEPGIKFASKQTSQNVLCHIEDIVFISTQKELTVVLGLPGVQYFINFKLKDELESFVGAVNAYFRLSQNWNVDLCTELPTPSLQFLLKNRCHGPIGKSAAAEKLESEPGKSILRLSSSRYSVFKLDVNEGENKPITIYTVVKNGDKFNFAGSEEYFEDLLMLTKRKIHGVGPLILLRPSENDVHESLLLCSQTKKEVEETDVHEPKVLNLDSFKSQTSQIIYGKYFCVIPSYWTAKKKRIVVKVLQVKELHDKFLASFSKFAFVSSNCLATIYGVILNPLSLVIEYFPSGPLNIYLDKNKKNISEVDLVQASTQLANAVYYLNNMCIIHGNIRCHNVFVAVHTEEDFKVKLSDPGVVSCTMEDIHWIPVEFHCSLSSALRCSSTDVWAFATTIWEIFSWGKLPLCGENLNEVMALYSVGSVLPKPESCPESVYQIMVMCWYKDSHLRIQAETAFRKLNQVFYGSFNARKANPYEAINNDSLEDSFLTQDDYCNESDVAGSVCTQMTDLSIQNGKSSKICVLPDSYFHDTEQTSRSSASVQNVSTLKLSQMLIPAFGNFHGGHSETSTLTVSPIPIGKSLLKFAEVIGKGNYGVVYRGYMEDTNVVTEVAIKTLRVQKSDENFSEDFRREINIMKELNHANIVSLLTWTEGEHINDIYIVMEYLPMGLRAYIKTYKSLAYKELLPKFMKFSMDIAEGMDYLESKCIIHRDLAARNVLVSHNERLKITDFGLARHPNDGSYYILRTDRELPLEWYAPECIEYRQFSHKSDVWSYGVTVWEMFTLGREPNLPKHPGELLQRLKNGIRLMCESPCSPSVYKSLIRPCWDEDPGQRPNFSSLKTSIRELEQSLV